MSVTMSSGCTARQADSKSKSAGAAAYRSSTDRVSGGRPVDADDVLDGRAAGADAVHVLLLADHDLGAGVVEQVGQLFGGQRVVYRKRSGADVLGADLERVELDPVGHHQRNRVAPPNPQTRQTGRHLAAPAPHTLATSTSGCHRASGVRRRPDRSPRCAEMPRTWWPDARLWSFPFSLAPEQCCPHHTREPTSRNPAPRAGAKSPIFVLKWARLRLLGR